MKLFDRVNSTSGLQLFQVIRFAGFFLTGIAMARLGVSTADIGNYEKLMLLSSAVSFFWVQGILNTMLASYHEHKYHGSFFFNIFVLLSVSAIVIYGLMRLGSAFFVHWISDGYLPGYRLICLYILFNTPCYLIEYIYLIKKEQAHLVYYGIVSAVFSIAAVVIPLAAGYSVETALACLVLWTAARFLWLLRLVVKNSSLEFNIPLLRKTFLLASPLIVSYLIAGSTDYIDAFMVTRFYGDESFALFRYGAKEFPLSLLLANALSMAMIPAISASFASGLSELKQQSKRLMHGLFPISIVLLVTSQWLYPLVFDNRFVASATYFNIYLLLVISRTVFPHPVAFAKKQNKAALLISLAEVIVNIVLSYMLMLRFGIAGIAFGTVAAHYIEKILMCIFIYRKYNVKPAEYVPITTWIIYTVCISLVYAMVTMKQ